MNKKILLLITSIVLVTSVFFLFGGFSQNAQNSETVAVPSHAKPNNLKQEYEQVVNVIQMNCPTCVEADKKKLEKSVSDLERLIKLGINELDAKLWLARSYRWLALGFDKQNVDQYLTKEHEIYKNLIEANPNNFEILSGYSSSLNLDEKVVEYQSFLKNNPDNAEAHHTLANLYLALSPQDTESAVNELREAFRLSKYERAWNYGRELQSLLLQMGSNEEAEKVSAELKKVRESL